MSATDVRCYRVEHRTAYRYEEPVTLSHHQLRVTPRPLPHQRSRAHELALAPAPAYRCERSDAFGNSVTELAIESAHSELEIVARSTVEVRQREVPPAETKAPWEDAREALAYRAGWRPDPEVLEATQFLFESPHARVKRDLRAYASDCFRPGLPLLEAAKALMSKIHSEFKFDAKATTITTPVMKFFEQKRGVCQDFTHFMISCLRSTGLAARYVSGYVLTRPGPVRQRPAGAEASHAWLALFVPGAGWIELDPTNNVLPSWEHITLGWGRDFSDVTPLRGVINGGGKQTIEVTVAVELDENSAMV
ncbi:MAG TPA: transglutaminase family protein [Candidatus Binatia bacterium]|nr:transglutaminase family protein [Candidatus Binatia bacterium]